MAKTPQRTEVESTADVVLPDMTALGALIRSRRKALRLTQAGLGGLSGVSHKFINEIEQGKETAEIGKVIRVAQMLGIDLLARTR